MFDLGDGKEMIEEDEKCREQMEGESEIEDAAEKPRTKIEFLDVKESIVEIIVVVESVYLI